MKQLSRFGEPQRLTCCRVHQAGFRERADDRAAGVFERRQCAARIAIGEPGTLGLLQSLARFRLRCGDGIAIGLVEAFVPDGELARRTLDHTERRLAFRRLDTGVCDRADAAFGCRQRFSRRSLQAIGSAGQFAERKTRLGGCGGTILRDQIETGGDRSAILGRRLVGLGGDRRDATMMTTSQRIAADNVSDALRIDISSRLHLLDGALALRCMR